MEESGGQITFSQIAKLLECPICLQHSETDSYLQCRNGHHGCVTCFSQLETCPVCRISLTLTINALPDELVANVRKELKHFKVLEGPIDYTRLIPYSKCTICNIISTQRPIYQCPDGHKLCFKCFHDINHCKICNTFTFILAIRNLLFEKILNGYEKPCRWMQYGCTAQITELNDHEKNECRFNEVKCIFIKCQQRVSMANMLEHLSVANTEPHYKIFTPIERNLGKIHHTNTGILNVPQSYGESYFFHQPPGFNTITYLKLENKYNFFFECFAYDRHQKCYFWVYYLGIQSEADNFGFNLRLYNPNSKKEICVTGSIVSLNVKYSRVIDTTFVYQIDFKKVKEFWNQNILNLSWEVSIFRKLNSENQINLNT